MVQTTFYHYYVLLIYVGNVDSNFDKAVGTFLGTENNSHWSPYLLFIHHAFFRGYILTGREADLEVGLMDCATFRLVKTN